MKPLKERSASVHLGMNLPSRFGPQFFFKRGQRGETLEAKDLYNPQGYPTGLNPEQFVGSVSSPAPEQGTFVWWRTAELPAEAPKTLDAKTRDKAIAAWKRIKARDLAKAEAERLAKEAEKFGDSPVVIRQKILDEHEKLKKEFPTPEAQDRVKFFYFSNVSPLVPGIPFSPGRDQPSPYQVTPTEDVPYPDVQGMTRELMEHRDKPLSTAFVMADLPKDIFYVSVLESKDPKSADDFGRTVYAPLFPGMSGTGPVVQQEFYADLRNRARADAVALLKAELKYEKENPDFGKKGGDAGD